MFAYSNLQCTKCLGLGLAGWCLGPIKVFAPKLTIKAESMQTTLLSACITI